MGRNAAIILSVVAWALAAWGPARAETRMALVIGNSNYAHGGKLTNPVNDAALITDALRKVGFTVEMKTDLDRDGLEAALKAFARNSALADTAVVYYSGHGMEIAGTNYLIPVDATLASDTDVQFEAVPLDLVMTSVGGARRLKVVILDACRNNPFFDAMRRSNGQKGVSVGLARPVASGGMLIAYAAREGTTAANGEGANSPYAVALAKHLPETGVDVRVMFGEVQEDVLNATGGNQEPSAYESIGGKGFYLTPAATAPPAPVVLTSPPSPVTPSIDPKAIELKYWGTVDTRDPAQLRAYLLQYPHGLFAGLARAKLADRGPAPVITGPTPAAGGGRALGRNTFRDCSDCPEMIRVTAGEFVMGIPSAEDQAEGSSAVVGDHSRPLTRVVFPRGFALGEFPVTRAEYLQFMDATGYRPDGGCAHFTRQPDRTWRYVPRDDLNVRNPGFPQTPRDPAVCVSWNDAQAYVAWLSKRTGHVYRLPSEAEWEYAARGDVAGPRWWGAREAACTHANVRGSAFASAEDGGPQSAFSCVDGYLYTSPVDKFPANPFGVHDALGNVWNWTEDCWNPDLTGLPADGSARVSGDCTHRVSRGTSWSGNAIHRHIVRASAGP